MMKQSLVIELAEAFASALANVRRMALIADKLARRGIDLSTLSDVPHAALLPKIASRELMPELVLWYWSDDVSLGEAALLPLAEQVKVITSNKTLASRGKPGLHERPAPLASMPREMWRGLCREADEHGCTPMQVLVLAGVAADELSAVIPWH